MQSERLQSRELAELAQSAMQLQISAVVCNIEISVINCRYQ